MQETHLDAESRYELLRKESRIQAMASMPSELKDRIILTEINEKALKKSMLWDLSENRITDWPWHFGAKTYKRRYPKRFELAVWSNEYLCSLSIGRPSYNGTRLRLDFIERSPGNCPIQGKVMPVNLLCAELME